MREQKKERTHADAEQRHDLNDRMVDTVRSPIGAQGNRRIPGDRPGLLIGGVISPGPRSVLTPVREFKRLVG